MRQYQQHVTIAKGKYAIAKEKFLNCGDYCKSEKTKYYELKPFLFAKDIPGESVFIEKHIAHCRFRFFIFN